MDFEKGHVVAACARKPGEESAPVLIPLCRDLDCCLCFLRRGRNRRGRRGRGELALQLVAQAGDDGFALGEVGAGGLERHQFEADGDEPQAQQHPAEPAGTAANRGEIECEACGGAANQGHAASPASSVRQPAGAAGAMPNV